MQSIPNPHTDYTQPQQLGGYLVYFQLKIQRAPLKVKTGDPDIPFAAAVTN